MQKINGHLELLVQTISCCWTTNNGFGLTRNGLQTMNIYVDTKVNIFTTLLTFTCHYTWICFLNICIFVMWYLKTSLKIMTQKMLAGFSICHNLLHSSTGSSQLNLPRISRTPEAPQGYVLSPLLFTLCNHDCNFNIWIWGIKSKTVIEEGSASLLCNCMHHVLCIQKCMLSWCLCSVTQPWRQTHFCLLCLMCPWIFIFMHRICMLFLYV